MPDIYTLTDADGIVKLVTPFEATANAGVIADSELTKNTETELEHWVAPDVAKKEGDNYVLIETGGLYLLNSELHGYYDQENSWRMIISVFEDKVKIPGLKALDSAGQAALNYAGDTTYSVEIRIKGLRNLRFGTRDGINSPTIFSQRLDLLPEQTRTALINLTTMFLWIDRATGLQITMEEALNPANQWGTLTTFKPYARPIVSA